MTSMLCVDEPFASAIVHGLKRWETRSAPPNGEMRPEGVSGFPGARLARGERIIIASTRKRPRHEQRNVNDDLPLWCDLYSFARHVEWTEHDDFYHGGLYRWTGPVGVILGSVVVTDAVPITDDCDWTAHICHSAGGLLAHSAQHEPWVDGETEHDISDQLPWGNWQLDNWAWKLADPKPTTEECPVCEGTGSVPVTGNGYDGFDQCPVCSSYGSCPPIPVRGHQGLRPFTLEALR